MPWLLHRYVLGELLRVFALCATVLVVLIAFGAAIKPLAGDDLIGPLQTAKYVLLAIVPMLQFALPFAAGFAATLVMHRLTADNEILAAAVSGISYQRILRPIVGLGLLLLVVMVLLTQWTIPRFWALMERIVTTDLTRLVEASIEKGLPVQIGNMQIYADRLRVEENPQDTNAQTRLVLFRVVAAELDGAGRIVTDVAARQAVVDIHERDGQKYLMLAMVDTVAYNGRTGELIQAAQIKPEQAIPVPSPSRDDTLFMTFGQLRWLRHHPDVYGPVKEAKLRLAQALRQHELWNTIARQINTTGEVELSGGWGGRNHHVTVHADQFNDDRFSSMGGRPVEIREIVGGDDVRVIIAGEVSVRRAVGSTMAEPAIDLLLRDCRVTDLRAGGTANQRAELTFPDLSLARLPIGDPSQLPYQELLDQAAGVFGSVRAEADFLRYRVQDMGFEIESGMARRYALSVTAMLLLLLGATLAMWMRHSLPLVIYFWAFVPSIMDIILISGGHNMIRGGEVITGYIVMWSGNGLLLVVMLLTLSRLMRH